MSQEVRDEVQQTAKLIWRQKGRKGTLAAATGVGKTKPAIDVMMELWWGWCASLDQFDIIDGPSSPVPKIFLAVPTEELRDVSWPDEVRKHHGDDGMMMWDKCVTAVCYISMHKYRGEQYDLFVGDEIHHISTLNSTFFKNNVVIDRLCLTATEPDIDRDPIKWTLLNDIAPVVFTFPLDQAVEEGLVAPYQLTVIMSSLEKVARTIKAGTKAKPFMTTEQKQYEHFTATLQKFYIKGNEIETSTTLIGTAKDDARRANGKSIDAITLKRMHFLYNLPSKEKLLRAVIDREITQKADVRTIVFCASIAQADKLFGADVYHSKSKGDALSRFSAGSIRSIGCVKSLNEGVNLPELDQGIIAQIDSNQRNLVQRLGRIIRYRPGHTGQLYLLCTTGTQDEAWMKKSIEYLDPARINFVSSKTYVP